MDKKYIEKILNNAQYNCKARLLNLQDILDFKKKSEKIVKKIKNLNLEEDVRIYFEAYQGSTQGGFKYLNTCVYAFFDVNGKLNKLEVCRDKKAYSVCRIVISNHFNLDKKTKELLSNKVNCTEYGYINL